MLSLPKGTGGDTDPVIGARDSQMGKDFRGFKTRANGSGSAARTQEFGGRRRARIAAHHDRRGPLGRGRDMNENAV